MITKMLTIIILLIPEIALGKQTCIEKDDDKKTCYRETDFTLNGPFQERYDEQMKSSGKWELAATTCLYTGILGLGGIYYGLSKRKKYQKTKEERDLTESERREKGKWDLVLANSLGVTAGSLLFGLVSYGMEVHYKREAHALAAKVGIDF